MPLYHYTARNQNGATMRGELQAEDNAAAVRHLRGMGLWVMDLRAAGGGGVSGGAARGVAENVVFPLYTGVSEKDKSLLYRQLHSMLVAGMPIYQSLTTLHSQTTNGRLKQGLRGIMQHVQAGGRISEAMAHFPWLFTRLEVKMIEAGEAGGLLEDVLRRLSEYMEREYNLRLQVKQRTLYPKILVLALIFIPNVVTWVMKGFGAYISDVGRSVLPTAVLLVAGWTVYRYLLRTQAFRDITDQVKLVLPVIGVQVRKLAIARFARALAALYHAGVPISSAVQASGEASDNAVLLRATQRIVPSIERGTSLSQAMAATRFFPPMFLGMVSTGEQTGSLDNSLDKAAEYYENEAQHATIQLVVILGVVLLLVMAIIIAVKVVSFYGGMYGGLLGGGE